MQGFRTIGTKKIWCGLSLKFDKSVDKPRKKLVFISKIIINCGEYLCKISGESGQKKIWCGLSLNRDKSGDKPPNRPGVVDMKF